MSEPHASTTIAILEVIETTLDKGEAGSAAIVMSIARALSLAANAADRDGHHLAAARFDAAAGALYRLEDANEEAIANAVRAGLI